MHSEALGCEYALYHVLTVVLYGCSCVRQPALRGRRPGAAADPRHLWPGRCPWTPNGMPRQSNLPYVGGGQGPPPTPGTPASGRCPWTPNGMPRQSNLPYAGGGQGRPRPRHPRPGRCPWTPNGGWCVFGAWRTCLCSAQTLLSPARHNTLTCFWYWRICRRGFRGQAQRRGRAGAGSPHRGCGGDAPREHTPARQLRPCKRGGMWGRRAPRACTHNRLRPCKKIRVRAKRLPLTEPLSSTMMAHVQMIYCHSIATRHTPSGQLRPDAILYRATYSLIVY
jgi:transposase